MKKSRFILVALVTFAIVSCASGRKPQRPKPLPGGRRHRGSVALIPSQHPVVQNIGS